MIKNKIDTMLFTKYIKDAYSEDIDVEEFSKEDMRAEIIDILKKQCRDIAHSAKEEWTKEVVKAKLRAIEQLLEYFDIRYNNAAPTKPTNFHLKIIEEMRPRPSAIYQAFFYDMSEFEAYVDEKIDKVFSADKSNVEIITIARLLSVMIDVLQENNIYSSLHEYEIEYDEDDYASLRSFTINNYEPQIEFGL